MRTVKNIFVVVSLTYSFIMAALGWLDILKSFGRWLVARKKTA